MFLWIYKFSDAKVLCCGYHTSITKKKKKKEVNILPETIFIEKQIIKSVYQKHDHKHVTYYFLNARGM